MKDLIERLSQIANCKTGDPMPECLRADGSFESIAQGDRALVRFGTNDWVAPLSAIANEAIAEIMRLRTTLAQLQTISGMASAEGKSFADIKKEIRKS